MVRKFVSLCDWCKQESELTHTLQIKKGKKAGRSYDICSSCASALEQRLVSDVVPATPIPAAAKARRTLGDMDVSKTPEADENDEIYAKIVAGGHTRPSPSEAESPAPTKATALTNNEGGCSHANRGRIVQKGKGFVQSCRDCGQELPYKRALNTKQGLDTGGHDIKLKDL